MLTQELINTFNSYSDIIRHLNLPMNGTGTRESKRLSENFDTSHFGNKPWQSKWKTLIKECPVCGKEFETKDNRDEKTTCSHSCSNTLFRSGENNPNWTGGINQYRKIAFQYYPHQCNICEWSKVPEVLEIHHKDRDRANNDPANLEILCPTCHQLEHFTSKDGRWAQKN